MIGIGQVGFIGHDAVASRDLVHPGGTVPDPLTGYEDGHLDVEGQDNLLER